jgi:predicted metal-binding protein
MGLESRLKCPGFEQAVQAVPELYICSNCGAEVEIWTDEKRGKCFACKESLAKNELRKVSHSESTKGEGQPKPLSIEPSSTGSSPSESSKKMQVEIREYVDDSGATIYYERYETDLSLPGFDHGKKYKALCEACPRHGKNLACPPYSPGFLDYVGNVKTGRVLCLRFPTEQFHQLIPEERYSACFRKARNLLVPELLKYRKQGYTVLGSGTCLACEKCAVEEGDEECKKPEKRIYSLESLGVNVIALTQESFDIDLEWSGGDHLADFVCALGAVFSNQETHS